MEHNVDTIETDILLIPLLLMVFAMFQMRLLWYKHNEEGKKWIRYISSVEIVMEAPYLLLKVKTVK